MNRKDRRISAKHGSKMMANGWNPFRLVDPCELSIASPIYRKSDKRPDRFYLNNLYTVQVHLNQLRGPDLYTLAMCRRNDEKPICSWADLFRIKNEIFGEEIEAVQFLPKKSELIDQGNLYWIWIKNTKGINEDFKTLVE